ncbi:30S ribosomal protein S4 [Candidatus Magnetobacterium bavaricum]|uniref:Small ribosomal subunit protein uS4 n=1 Tax=Candidatus Magnetobacterium bavaricum TaxID=29290 RepID=A0A0F3GLH2_9BACT|nr:30S ribosomal protein S4 [Candidatus Magnetobacterium bavaricum]
MARYRESLCRLCRRDGEKLFLKGQRCLTDKCSIERRKYGPGQHGQRRAKLSDFAIQLKEKQKVRRIYGVMEGQFRRYFAQADRKKGITGEMLLQFLELRLDNIVHRMGFAANRNQARQLVGHGHFLVNGVKVNIPSYRLKTGDKVSVVEASKAIGCIQESVSRTTHAGVPRWLEIDTAAMAGKVLHVPSRDDIPIEVKEQLIVEFYSR